MATTVDEIVDAVYVQSAEPPQFVSAQDIADEVGCTIQTVHNKKEEVLDREGIKSTKIGQAVVFYTDMDTDRVFKCWICKNHVKETDADTATIIVNSKKMERDLCPDCSQSMQEYAN